MKGDEIARAIWGVFKSPNVLDSNLESANLVDVVHSMGRQCGRIADAISELSKSVAMVAASMKRRKEPSKRRRKRTGLARRATLAFFGQDEGFSRVGTPKAIAEWCAAYGATVSSDAINAELCRGEGNRYRNVSHGKYTLYQSAQTEAVHQWNWWGSEYVASGDQSDGS